MSLEMLAKPSPQQLVSDPEKNDTGALTGIATEIGPITQGCYSIFSNRQMLLSQHQASGGAIGDHPVVVPADEMWAITVEFGKENYLIVQKYAGETDGTWWLNYLAGPY
jgi:hypothetical protein